MSLIRSSQNCLKCGSKRGKAVYSDNEHCFSCGEHLNKGRTFAVRESRTDRLPWTGELPKDYSAYGPPDMWHKWLAQYDFTYDSAWCQKEYGWSRELDRMIFPIYHNGELKAYQARSLDREPKWITCSPDYEWGKKYPAMFYPALKPEFIHKWVIVEDIVSAIKVGQTYPCISILGTTSSKSLCNFLLRYGQHFILWLDNDEAGEKAVKNLSTNLKMCAKISVIRSERDPKYYSIDEIKERIKLCCG